MINWWPAGQMWSLNCQIWAVTGFQNKHHLMMLDIFFVFNLILFKCPSPLGCMSKKNSAPLVFDCGICIALVKPVTDLFKVINRPLFGFFFFCFFPAGY